MADAPETFTAEDGKMGVRAFGDYPEYPSPEPRVWGSMSHGVLIIDGRHLAVWLGDDEILPLDGVSAAAYDKVNGQWVQPVEGDVADEALAAYKTNTPEYEPLPETMI